VQALLRNYGLNTTRVPDDGSGAAAPAKVKKKRHHS
jgi:hypothetical protein